MKRVIFSVNDRLSYFGALVDGKLEYYYLTKSQAKKYFAYLDKGHIVSFELYDKRKKIDNRYAWQVAYFSLIEKPGYRKNQILYDLSSIRKQMHDVLDGFDYLLFLDLEMTMPPYFKGPFEAEIIQAGFILRDKNGEVIEQESIFIKPTKYPKISPRTVKFLKLTDDYYDKALDYMHFYKRLRGMIEQYQPKIIVWGKNDMIALKASYRINEVLPITTEPMFINLLQIHKNYYNLSDDLGLFKAYVLYYNKTYDQSHDALDDAMVTKYVFDALLLQMKGAI
ncbi:MAG: exonuclease domain-containing protein [Acholeplasma sp.]|nr:exonuclease domain-containing protein [Acholeplasma sp.]